MAFDVTAAEVITRVVQALERAGVPYMLTGSMASALHGVPRTTQDIDLVVAPSAANLQKLLQQFPSDRYYVSQEAAQDAMLHGGMFNVVDLETGWKIDFIVRKARPFSQCEFDRRTAATAFGISLSVAAPEDVIIAKLEWAKLSSSERQLRDAAGIMRTQGAALDRTYIAHWVAELGLAEQWAAAEALAV